MAPHHYNNLPAMFRLANGGGIFARDPVARLGLLRRPNFGPNEFNVLRVRVRL